MFQRYAVGCLLLLLWREEDGLYIDTAISAVPCRFEERVPSLGTSKVCSSSVRPFAFEEQVIEMTDSADIRFAVLVDSGLPDLLFSALDAILVKGYPLQSGRI